MRNFHTIVVKYGVEELCQEQSMFKDVSTRTKDCSGQNIPPDWLPLRILSCLKGGFSKFYGLLLQGHEMMCQIYEAIKLSTAIKLYCSDLGQQNSELLLSMPNRTLFVDRLLTSISSA